MKLFKSQFIKKIKRRPYLPAIEKSAEHLVNQILELIGVQDEAVKQCVLYILEEKNLCDIGHEITVKLGEYPYENTKECGISRRDTQDKDL
ncbi:MAG: hypothetical protein ACK4MM_04005 [Fervidobacterium sp.]